MFTFLAGKTWRSYFPLNRKNRECVYLIFFSSALSTLENLFLARKFKINRKKLCFNRTFFSDVKSPGAVILSFSSRNLAMYSKSGVNFPLDVITAPETTPPTLLISCSSKGYNDKVGVSLIMQLSSVFTILHHCHFCVSVLFWVNVSHFYKNAAKSESHNQNILREIVTA